MTLKTDTAGVELELGKHLQAPFLKDELLVHVRFIPLDQAASALVDTDNRRVVWLSRSAALCFDFRCCGHKVKDAVKAYRRCYGPQTSLTAMQVRDGVVLSHQWTTQRHAYHWDWAKNRQVCTDAGWKVKR